MAKKSALLPNKIIAPLLAFLVIGAVIVAKIPSYNLSRYLDWTGAEENRLKLGVAAYVVFVFVAIVLGVFKKVFKLSGGWLLNALIFNGIIIFVKFMLSPNSYGNQAAGSLVATAFGVGLLYLVALYIVYLFFQGKILKSLIHKSKITEESKLLFIAGLFVLVNLVRVVLFTFTPLANTGAADYLGSVLLGDGLVLSGLIFLTIFGAVEAFDQLRTKRLALKEFFILSAVLLIIYHVLWVIFVHGLAGVGICNC